VKDWFLPPPSFAIIVGIVAIASTIGALLLDSVDAVFGAFLAVVALYIAAVDADRFEIPDIGCVFLLLLGTAWTFKSSGVDADIVVEIVARVFFSAGLLFVLRTVYRQIRDIEGLGLGDVKLAGAGAAWLSFPHMALALFVAAAAAILLIILRHVLSGERLEPRARIPFGAFLAPAIWAAWVIQVIGL
jgi:leader peptidase (prepilin peptidase)/N-methyltransferase